MRSYYRCWYSRRKEAIRESKKWKYKHIPAYKARVYLNSVLGYKIRIITNLVASISDIEELGIPKLVYKHIMDQAGLGDTTVTLQRYILLANLRLAAESININVWIKTLSRFWNEKRINPKEVREYAKKIEREQSNDGGDKAPN